MRLLQIIAKMRKMKNKNKMRNIKNLKIMLIQLNIKKWKNPNTTTKIIKMKHMLKNFFLQKNQICQYKKQNNNNKHRLSIDKSIKINKNLNRFDITQTEIEKKIFIINKKMN